MIEPGRELGKISRMPYRPAEQRSLAALDNTAVISAD